MGNQSKEMKEWDRGRTPGKIKQVMGSLRLSFCLSIHVRASAAIEFSAKRQTSANRVTLG